MTLPTDEQLLDRLRQWLADTRAAAEQLPEQLPELAEQAALPAEIGLYQLLEEFTALRHEVKLQVRGGRGLEEQAQALLPPMREALDALRSIGPREAQAAWSAGKGLALTLAELDEALDRGRRQVEQAMAKLPAPAEQRTLAERLQRAYVQLPWLQRTVAARYHRRALALAADAAPGERPLLAALCNGYDLMRQRLTRAMAEHSLIPIPTVGQPVDAEQMVVVGVVEHDGPGGIVVEEVRRGYNWNGRLLRAAEVIAAKTVIVTNAVPAGEQWA